MAISTTTTQANNILNEILNDRILKALTPRNVVSQLFNYDSMDGAASLSKEYVKLADDGAAAAATEGNDFSTITTMGYDTTVTVTPTEAAVARADITTRAMRRESPGMSANDVYSKFQSGDLMGVANLLADKVERLYRMCAEKLEVDAAACLDDYSNTAGSTGVDLTVANLLTALYSLEAAEPEHDGFAWVLHPEQINTIRSLLLTQAAAAASSGMWVSQADASLVNFNMDAAKNGLKGSFLNIPVYQTSHTVNPLPNAGADVAGALIAVGQGRPGEGLRGPNVILEGHAPVVLVDFDVSARSAELLVIHEYAIGEITDKHGVSIITDAP
jgi:hypothetical protein